MSDKIVLHHVPGSRSLRTLWLLSEMGITPEIENYAIPDGSLRTPDFLARSPAGRVPALEIDGQVIYESGAITEYLCETRPEHGLGRAVGDPERVPFLEAMHYAETMAVLVANLNLQWIFLRDPSQRSDTVVKIDARRLAATMAPLEKLLAQQDWILASGFSGADTMLGWNFLATPKYVRMDDFPNLAAYVARFSARPGFVRAKELDGPANFGRQDFYSVETSK
ncbi:glutathione S-transferase family protein [Pseudooceanicola sp.]|uniref:glutathione S-transferase family protein n=1 Tax=Pseudooceanicola sp. TaxID=1914328 RepID=UPI002604373D|nr:glutathione S-transferase family protein [Pseudooceanicola sp.]MDF1855679.1 glutathione S-transferase family protein [Pseudooceanicola sp.]